MNFDSLRGIRLACLEQAGSDDAEDFHPKGHGVVAAAFDAHGINSFLCG